MNTLQTLVSWLDGRLRQTARTCYALFRIMIPVIIAVKILQELHLVEAISRPFGPVMALVGLPAVFSLAWVSAMFNSMYAGLIVFAQLAQDQPVTAAQATVLATMMLVAHNLLVESAVARASGPRATVQLVLRVACALLLGAMLNQFYLSLDWLQEPARILFAASAPPPDLFAWALKELRNLGLIALIILLLVLVMGLLDASGVTARLNRLLAPALRLCGIGPEAAPITVIGMTLGLAYGGGLIIDQARSGKLDKRDVVFGLTLMGLCHSIIEDTMLMVLAGGHLSGILWGRLVFSMAATAVLVKASSLLPESLFDRIFWHGPAPASLRGSAAGARQEA